MDDIFNMVFINDVILSVCHVVYSAQTGLGSLLHLSHSIVETDIFCFVYSVLFQYLDPAWWLKEFD